MSRDREIHGFIRLNVPVVDGCELECDAVLSGGISTTPSRVG
jgi:hypothetical protein